MNIKIKLAEPEFDEELNLEFSSYDISTGRSQKVTFPVSKLTDGEVAEYAELLKTSFLSFHRKLREEEPNRKKSV